MRVKSSLEERKENSLQIALYPRGGGKKGKRRGEKE